METDNEWYGANIKLTIIRKNDNFYETNNRTTYFSAVVTPAKRSQ